MAKKRVAFVSNESFVRRSPHTPSGFAFELAEITEGEPGYRVAGVYTRLDLAQGAAKTRNGMNGLTDDDVWKIQTSSMRAGLTK